MFDIDEIMRQAQAASEAASQQLRESMEKSRKLTEQTQADTDNTEAERASHEAEEQAAERDAANRQRQVEILGRIFSPDAMAQMVANQELLQKAVDERWPPRPPWAWRK